MKIIAIIPARYDSTRFPGKPLIDLKGKTMIQRVYERVDSSQAFDQVLVATDDERIYNHVLSWGGEVVMTQNTHVSGTDRCAEVLQKNDAHWVVNIQGDEPLIDQTLLKEISKELKSGNSEIVSAYRAIDQQEAQDPNVVKVVMSDSGRALYFSRSIIPFERNKQELPYYQHIGVYGFSANTLAKLAQLPASKLENKEGLEQLRWLSNDYSIKMLPTSYQSIAIDTPEDVEKVVQRL